MASAFALIGCSDDGDDDGDDDGTGGVASDTGGAGGASDSGGAGGNTATGGNTEAGGTSDSGGATGDTACPGCAALFVPLAAADTSQEFEIYLDAPTDFTDEIVTVRVRVDTAGNAGGVQFAAKNGEEQQYAGWYAGWTNLADASDWTDIVLDFANPDPAFSEDYDPTQVTILSVGIGAGAEWEDGGATWGDTTVYVDSITFANAVIPDITFDANADNLNLGTFEPIEGSEITWVSE